VREGDDLTAFIVPKVMKNPEALTFRIPRGLLRPVAGKLYLLPLFVTKLTRQAMYVQCNMEALSRNHCCSGKAISITYVSVCACLRVHVGSRTRGRVHAHF
jgi:hypothetical protein